jgi:sugar transferase (PEP-CTERM system associated)
LLAVCIQLLLLFFVRAFFVNIFSVVGFKRCLLLLGEGPLVSKAEAWLAHHETGYTNVIRYDSADRHPHVAPRRGGFVSSTHAAAAFNVSPSDALPAFVSSHRIDEIVVANMGNHAGAVWELLDCRTSGVKVVDYLTFWERETGRIDLDAIEPNWLVYSSGFRTSLLRRIVERSLDIVVSSLGLVLMSPFMAIIALLIRLDSPGPVVFRQERIGKDDQPFEILKFRTMFTDPRPVSAQCTEFNDPRVTRVGRIFRPARLDELPQLVNVLKGDMSLVGPRPEQPTFVARFGRQIPFYGVRHSVRPGITGWAQINYKYAASLEDAKYKLEYDLFYVKNRSVFLDLAILLQTLRIILWQQGAR